jgi:ABC1 atypical kinase-like domain
MDNALLLLLRCYQVESIVCASMGIAALSDVFSEFDQKPLGSASIGQVQSLPTTVLHSLTTPVLLSILKFTLSHAASRREQ